MQLSHCKGAKGTRHKTVVKAAEAKASRTSSYLIIFLIVFVAVALSGLIVHINRPQMEAFML